MICRKEENKEADKTLKNYGEAECGVSEGQSDKEKDINERR